jgi:hypothetical protein
MRPRVLLISAVSLALLAGAAWFLLLRDGSSGTLSVSPREISFGRIPYGDAVLRTVTVTNESAGDVLIHSVTANCACFKVDRAYSSLLHSGESTEIRVTIVSGVVPAEPLRGKHLSILTQDQKIEVPLKGDILEVRRVSPTRIDVGEVSRAAPEGKGPWTVRVRPGPGFDVRLVGAAIEPAGTFAHETAPSEGGTDVTIRLVAAPDGPTPRPEGPFKAKLTLSIEALGEDGRRRAFSDVVPIEGVWK